MEAYKFETQIEKNGIIQLPKLDRYEGYDVEVMVVLKSRNTRTPKKQSIEAFFEKWKGVFSSVQTEDIRYNAIMQKHR